MLFQFHRSLTQNIRQLFSRKLTVWKKLKANRANSTLRESYNNISVECRLAVKKYEIARENKIIESNDINKFYRFVNNKMSNRSGVGSLTNSVGEHATTDIEKANILNKYFASVCTDDNGVIPPSSAATLGGCSLDSVKFDEVRIIRTVKKLKKKNRLSSGPDGYPTKLLTAVCHELATPLSMIFNSFMSVGKMPSTWKQATVIPIFKKALQQILQTTDPSPKPASFANSLNAWSLPISRTIC